DFRGHPNEGRLIGLRRQPAIDRVVAQVGPATHEPARKGRTGIIQRAFEWRLPMDAPRLACPERLPVLDRLTMEFMDLLHAFVSGIVRRTDYGRGHFLSLQSWCAQCYTYRGN